MDSNLNHIAIVGDGKMGTSLFQFLSHFDFKLVWVHITNPEKASKKYHRRLKRALKNELIDQNQFDFKMQNHIITESLADVSKSDLIIECIFEDLNAKRELVQDLFKIKKAEAIIASNSSSLFPDRLSDSDSQRQKIMGLHFFFPVETKAMVELLPSGANSDEDLLRVQEFIKKIAKSILIQSREDAFLLNRIMLKWQALAYNYFVESDYSVAQIDSVINKHLACMGIFEMMDFIGLDLIYQSSEAYTEGQDDKEIYSLLLDFLKTKIKDNQIGVKSNEGFYTYPQNAEITALSVDAEQEILQKLVTDFELILEWAQKISCSSMEDLEFCMNEYLDTDIKNWKKLV